MENSRHLQVLMSEQGDIDFQKELFALIYQQCSMVFSIWENNEFCMNEMALYSS